MADEPSEPTPTPPDTTAENVVPFTTERRVKKSNGSGSGPGDPPGYAGTWKTALQLTPQGRPAPFHINIMVALRACPDLAGLCALDEFTGLVNLTRRPPWFDLPEISYPRVWRDEDDINLCEFLQNHGIAVAPSQCATATLPAARENPFHPVKDYLDALRGTWDGKPRINTWLIDYAGAPDTEYTRAVSSKWLLSAIARIAQPGCQADYVLVLEGKQNIGKSRLLRTLGGKWYREESAELGSKDAMLNCRGAWIIELAELAQLRRAEMNKVKAFITRTTDTFRPPYGRKIVEWPRQCIYGGSVNSQDWQTDDTGGRRWWPVWCEGDILIEAVAQIRDQIWAEAVTRFLNGEPWWIDDSTLQQKAEEEQAQRIVDEPWLKQIADILANGEKLSIAEIMCGGSIAGIPIKCLGIPTDRATKTDANRVAAILRQLGADRVKPGKFGEKGRVWHYFLPPDLPPQT